MVFFSRPLLCATALFAWLLPPAAQAFDFRRESLTPAEFAFVAQLGHVETAEQQVAALRQRFEDHAITEVQYKADIAAIHSSSSSPAVLVPHCTVTMLSPGVALTAAHCLRDRTAPSLDAHDTAALRVIFGPWSRGALSALGGALPAGGRVAAVARTVVFPAWQGCGGTCRPHTNDVALLFLKTCMPDAVAPASGGDSGGGAELEPIMEFPKLNVLQSIDAPEGKGAPEGPTSASRQYLAWTCSGDARVLARGALRILDANVAAKLFDGSCGRDAFGGEVTVGPDLLCLQHGVPLSGAPQRLRSTCGADSGGGPLLVETMEGYTLLGVGVGGEFEDSFSVPMVRVSRFVKWILATVEAHKGEVCDAAAEQAAQAADATGARATPAATLQVERDESASGVENLAPSAGASGSGVGACCCFASPQHECYLGAGALYRGGVRVTKRGALCQDWAAQAPVAHATSAATHPRAGLTSNFCRNPGGAKAAPWCYPGDYAPGKMIPRWEACAVEPCTLVPQSTDAGKACAGEAHPASGPGSGTKAHPAATYSHSIKLAATVSGFNRTTFTNDTRLHFRVAVATSLGISLREVVIQNVSAAAAAAGGSAAAAAAAAAAVEAELGGAPPPPPPQQLTINFVLKSNDPKSLVYWMEKGGFLHSLAAELALHGIPVSQEALQLAPPSAKRLARRRRVDVVAYSLSSAAAVVLLGTAGYKYWQTKKAKDAENAEYAHVGGEESGPLSGGV